MPFFCLLNVKSSSTTLQKNSSFPLVHKIQLEKSFFGTTCKRRFVTQWSFLSSCATHIETALNRPNRSSKHSNKKQVRNHLFLPTPARPAGFNSSPRPPFPKTQMCVFLCFSYRHPVAPQQWPPPSAGACCTPSLSPHLISPCPLPSLGFHPGCRVVTVLFQQDVSRLCSCNKRPRKHLLSLHSRASRGGASQWKFTGWQDGRQPSTSILWLYLSIDFRYSLDDS